MPKPHGKQMERLLALALKYREHHGSFVAGLLSLSTVKQGIRHAAMTNADQRFWWHLMGGSGGRGSYHW